MKKIFRFRLPLVLAIFVIALVSWDLLSVRSTMVTYPLYKVFSTMDHTASNPTTVSIVGSDLAELSSPVSLSTALTEVQIDSMVCKALDLQGSAKTLFTSGKKYLIKPNIVGATVNGNGENTDTRVVKSLVKYIHKKTGGNCSILIGEGSPRPMPYEVKYSGTAKKWTVLWDVAGYPTLLSQLKALGINVDTVNLNGGATNYLTGNAITSSLENLQEVIVPNGGYAAPQGGKYYIHKAIINADVYITVPVLKVHNPGITNALKNQIGIAPGNRYGFNKMQGVTADGKVNKLTHSNDFPRDWTDEEIVDLSLLAGIDLVVVDATMCLARQKTYAAGNDVRMNTILVGNDPVAVDNVAARITGFNPDDVDHIVLAELSGMGTNNPDLITTVGSTMAHVTNKLAKSTSDFRLMFGRSNRVWLVSPTYSANDITTYSIANEANYIAQAGVDSWSQPIYFFDDRIDLGNYFSYTSNVVSYAFTYVYAPVAKDAVLWVGSDEALKIYLNGTAVYNYTSSRTYTTSEIVKEKISIHLNQGNNTLLVKSLQKSGNYDFALNICEVESNTELEGNRVAGLKFSTTANGTTNSKTFDVFEGIKSYPNPATEYATLEISSNTSQNVRVNIYDLGGRLVKRLMQRNSGSDKVIMTWNLGDSKGNRVPAGHYIAVEESSKQRCKIVVTK